MISVYSCFVFKQKAAYDLRISYWSSDVCSSDLKAAVAAATVAVDAYSQVIEGIAQELEQASMEQVPSAVIARLQTEARPLGETAEMMLSSLILEKQNTLGELAAGTDKVYDAALHFR